MDFGMTLDMRGMCRCVQKCNAPMLISMSASPYKWRMIGEILPSLQAAVMLDQATKEHVISLNTRLRAGILGN